MALTRLDCGPGVSCEVFYLPRGPRGVILLHGFSFRYGVWLEAGAEEAVGKLGFSLAAPDMPYGRSTSCTRRNSGLEVNLSCIQGAAGRAGIGEAIVVGASLGARYAVHAALRYEWIRGLVLAGPALGRDREGTLEAARRLRGRVEAVVIRGSIDVVTSRRMAMLLAEALGGEYVELPRAGHVIPRDAPGEVWDAVRRVAARLGWLPGAGSPSA